MATPAPKPPDEESGAAPNLLRPEEHVLSTLEHDGSRRWLQPKLSRGKYLERRRWVAYGLIALYAVLPHLSVGGDPLFLLDLPARRFTLFGFTFLPTDTLLLALFMVGTLLTVFFATALAGRVWCGWACPHTVYMEFLFRPIERLFDGTRGRGGKPRSSPTGWRTAGKYAVFFALSLFLANTFLAYFVGPSQLSTWMTQSPASHPVGFVIVAVLTGAMMFHFSYFREQLCIIACPYGRLQSALLDDHSRIVSYDARRGEPRGKRRRLDVISNPVGDCVDCRLCVQTCPTGIDIREGLQMECVNCTQCMDACDAVMTKLGREPGLIRYGSQAEQKGESSKLLRPRLIIYPAILAVLAGLFFTVLTGKTDFDAVLLRNGGQPFTVTDDGRVRNVLRLKLTNRSDQPLTFEVTATDAPGVEVVAHDDTLTLAPRQTRTFPLSAVAEEALFVAHRGRLELTLSVLDDGGDTRDVECSLLGPDMLRRPAPGPEVPTP